MEFSTVVALIFIAIYDHLIVPFSKKTTCNDHGMIVLQRIKIGMFLFILCMVTRTLVEKKRTHVASTCVFLETPKIVIPLGVFLLIPQFSLLWVAYVFTLVGLQEYFYD